MGGRTFSWAYSDYSDGTYNGSATVTMSNTALQRFRALLGCESKVKYFPRVATEYLHQFSATPNLVPYLKVCARCDSTMGGRRVFWGGEVLCAVHRRAIA